MSERIRLSKRLADLGICSRREADELIEQGLIFVNGERCNVLGTKVSLTDEIRLDPQAKKSLEEKVTIAVHKPVGYVSGQAEDGYIPAIRLITQENHFQPQGSRTPFKRSFLDGLAPVGRLDIDSKGLLLLTQDGVLAKAIIGADSNIEKEYIVKVERDFSEKDLARFADFSLDGKKLKPVKIKKMGDRLYSFILIEGKKRQIRRMVEAMGNKVQMLKRVRIGKLKLGLLPEGKWHFVKKSDII